MRNSFPSYRVSRVERLAFQLSGDKKRRRDMNRMRRALENTVTKPQAARPVVLETPELRDNYWKAATAELTKQV